MATNLPLRVLLTGAAGHIGTMLRPSFRERYLLRTLDLHPVPGDPQAIQADLSDAAAMARATQDIDVVVHLAGNRSPVATFETLLAPNIVGVHTLFAAAAKAGVRRLVYASSCHAVLGYPTSPPVQDHDPVRPPDLYGVTKVFGEALGRYYHDQHGLEFVGLRIGSAMYANPSPRAYANPMTRLLWISPRDLVQLCTRAVEQPNVGFVLAHGTSRVEPAWLSLRSARTVLGYDPQDELPAVPPTPLPVPFAD